MLARRKIRSQMYVGVAMLVVIVAVLSAASFQGSLKFRNLTKTTRNRATELPLAADLKGVPPCREVLKDAVVTPLDFSSPV